MKYSFALIISLCFVQTIRSDFTACTSVPGLSKSLSEKSSQIVLGESGRKLALNYDGEKHIVTEASFAGSELVKYDGFYCNDSEPQSSDAASVSLNPCKQYLYYAHNALKSDDSESLVCFREVFSDKKTIAIMVLNVQVGKSIEEDLKEIDSYSEVNRYFIAVLELIARTADSYVPILNVNSDFRWTKSKNLIVAFNSLNQITVRFRFIDTNIGQPSRRILGTYIEQAFYYIKVFLYKSTSCKEIVRQEYQYDKAMEALMHLDPTFPKNFRRIFAAIERTCKDSPAVITPAKLKHKILMKMVVLGYCQEHIRYDMETLHALIDLVGSIFVEDQMFDRADEQARFENYFFEETLKTETVLSKTAQEMMELDETGRYIEKEVVNEPAFGKLVDRDRGNGLESRERRLWLERGGKEDYEKIKQMIEIE
jgi:hypothetical protein